MTGALIGEEEKGLVLDDGSAEVAAELVLLQHGPVLTGGVKEEAVGVELIVAEELKESTVELGRAGAGHQYDSGAATAAILGIVEARLDLELLNRFGRRCHQSVRSESVFV